MLYLLTQELVPLYHGFAVFQYLTLRAVLATLTALGIALLVGPPVIEWLKPKKNN